MVSNIRTSKYFVINNQEPQDLPDSTDETLIIKCILTSKRISENERLRERREHSLINTQLQHYVQHKNMKYVHVLKKIERLPYQIIKQSKIIKNQLEML